MARAKRKEGPPRDARLALTSADAFRRLSQPFLEQIGMDARTAHERAVRDIGGMIASATNLSLSVELHLKALRIAIGMEVPTTHNLERLFSDLPNALKEFIERRYDALRAQRPPPGEDIDPLERLELQISVGPFREEQVAEAERQAASGPLDNSLRAILERSKGAFQTWRYLYERGDPGAISTFLYECTYLGIAAEALRQQATEALTPHVPNRVDEPRPASE